jgi:hypothetical protein
MLKFLHTCIVLLNLCGCYISQCMSSVCVIWYILSCQLGESERKGAKNTCGNSVYSGTVYTFPVLFGFSEGTGSLVKLQWL